MPETKKPAAEAQASAPKAAPNMDLNRPPADLLRAVLCFNRGGYGRAREAQLRAVWRALALSTRKHHLMHYIKTQADDPERIQRFWAGLGPMPLSKRSGDD